MLGLADLHYFSGELVEPLISKYPLPLFISPALSSPQVVKILLCEVLCVLALMVKELLKFHLKEVMLGYLAL
jgi:hypothetical protein